MAIMCYTAPTKSTQIPWEIAINLRAHCSLRSPSGRLGSTNEIHVKTYTWYAGRAASGPQTEYIETETGNLPIYKTSTNSSTQAHWYMSQRCTRTCELHGCTSGAPLVCWHSYFGLFLIELKHALNRYTSITELQQWSASSNKLRCPLGFIYDCVRQM